MLITFILTFRRMVSFEILAFLRSASRIAVSFIRL